MLSKQPSQPSALATLTGTMQTVCTNGRKYKESSTSVFCSYDKNLLAEIQYLCTLNHQLTCCEKNETE